METPICKFMICLVALLLVLGFRPSVEGASVCGKSTPDQEAMKLAPCATAAQDATASVSGSCCKQAKSIGKRPSCLCAVLLSDTAKQFGIKPEIAITIPKRCNLADRPVGYKCGNGISQMCICQMRNEGCAYARCATNPYTLP